MSAVEIEFNPRRASHQIFGPHEEHLRLIEQRLGVSVVARGGVVKISGPDSAVSQAEHLVRELIRSDSTTSGMDRVEIEAALRRLTGERRADEPFDHRIEVASKKRYIVPKTPAQVEYVQAIRRYDIVMAIGPAGTGKTYLAMACAVSSFVRGDASRIILVRPAVEAGEKLGFLPGDMVEKVSPYLRPLYDALYDMMEVAKIQRHIDTGVIEVAPLAFMRGRSLNDSFIILDEAQNCTSEQMKMFLTRMGFNSKVVVTGDITQVDLPDPSRSGLIQVQDILRHVEGIRFCYLTEKDVVRHELVQRIVHAYETHEASVSRPRPIEEQPKEPS